MPLDGCKCPAARKCLNTQKTVRRSLNRRSINIPPRDVLIRQKKFGVVAKAAGLSRAVILRSDQRIPCCVMKYVEFVSSSRSMNFAVG